MKLRADLSAFSVFIRHPILALMVNLAMVTAGIFALTRLNVASMPDVDIPVVVITTILEGGSPELIETEITKPIEDAVSIVPGLDELKSTSDLGRSMVTVKFKLGIDGNVALQDCRDKVEAILDNFPDGTKRPVFSKVSEAEKAVLVLAVSGQRSGREMADIAQYSVSDVLQTVPGVGNIEISGARKRSIQIELESEKLKEHELSASAVFDEIRKHSQKMPGGRLTSNYSEYVVNLENHLKTAQDFADIVVAQPKDGEVGVPVTVGDLGRVTDGQLDATNFARLDGRETILLNVKKTADANLVNVVEAIKSRLDDLKAQLPADVKVAVVQDNSDVVHASMNDLYEDLILGSALACLTVLVFLGNFRLTLIAGTAIPISLITTFAFMDVLGYTINSMTLLALSLAVGIVVDDAVVVLENIYKVLEEKNCTPIEAAQEGLQEIAFAVLATTASLVVLFLPLAFMPGVVGMYFQSWGVVMAVSIALSMVVSFTLTPTLCALWLKKPSRSEGPSRLTLALQNGYVHILRHALRARYLVAGLACLTLLSAGYLASQIPTEFIADEDEANYYITFRIPPGWPLARCSEALKPIEKRLRELPHIQHVLSSGDAHQVSLTILMPPYATRKPYTIWDSVREARQLLSSSRVLEPSIQTDVNPAFEFVIVGDELDVLRKLSQEMRRKLSAVEGIVDVTSTLRPAGPQVSVQIDQERAADLQVDVEDAARTVQMLVGGIKVTNFNVGARSYEVRMRLVANERAQPEDVRELFVPTAQNGLVTLDRVASITNGVGSGSIERFGRRRKFSLYANMETGFTLGDAQDAAGAALASLKPPPGYEQAQTGNSKLMAQTAIAALQSFLLSVALMYMVLASQFESFLEPGIILFTLPLSIPFALLSLLMAGMSLNLFSVLGLFLLFGVVKKNAILQIDRTNQLRASGLDSRTAILEANRDRLRPILMTTLTLVVAMIPVALAGPAGASRAPMAMVVVGGQSLCLLLTLVVVPALTLIVEDLHGAGSWLRRKFS